MSIFDYSNYGKRDYSLYQVNLAKKEEKEVKVEEEKKVPVYEQKQVDADGANLSAIYNMVSINVGKKADVSALGLSEADQKIVGKYVNEEQQAVIAQDFMSFFA